MISSTQRSSVAIALLFLAGSTNHLSQAFSVLSKQTAPRGRVSLNEKIIGESDAQSETKALEVEDTSPPKTKKVVKKASGGGNHKEGVFSPIVYLAKDVLGKDELNKLRGKVIAMHSGVISKFVDTHETPFGQAVLSALYKATDTDGDGKLSADEIESALGRLGFVWLKEKQIGGIVKRADLDENGEIDWDEYVKAAPKTIRTNLTKLAKKNGTDMGLLV